VAGEQKIRGLTAKQKRFCEEYVIDWNATRAAIAAGYAAKNADIVGYKNTQKPMIKAYIEHIQKDLAQLAGLSQLRNLNELKKIAFTTIADLHNTWIERKDFENLTEEQKAAIESIDTKIEVKGDKETHYVKIKLFDKLKALDSINKMLGWNAPIKTEGTVVNINTEPLSTDEIKAAKDKLNDAY
jgi:phage terminase small subunit